MRLEQRTAIVTGGSRGIGAAIAEALAADGANVVITGRKQDALDAKAHEINERVGAPRVLAHSAHAGDVEQIRAVVEWTTGELGVPTILVNNAATNPYFGPMLDVEWSAWDKTFDVNVKGYFEATRQVTRGLIDAGLEGSIINVASIYGLKGGPLQGVYAMTKAAIISMTQTLALELGHAGIRVNAICPGLVETKFASILVGTPEIASRYVQRTALGRWGQPDDVAGVATFLASDDSRYVTGQHITVDGGYLIGD